MDCRLQGRHARLFEFRYRCLSHRNHAARLCGVAHPQETGLGRAEDASEKCPGSVAVRPARVPEGVENLRKIQVPSSRETSNPKSQIPKKSKRTKLGFLPATFA